MASRAVERVAADLQAARDRSHAARLREAGGVTALLELVAVLDEQAAHIIEGRRSAWQGRSKTRITAATVLRDLLDLLERNPAPVEVDHHDRAPLDKIPSPDRHADLDPADGAFSGQISDRVMFGNTARSCSAEYPAQPGVAPGGRVVRCGRESGHHLGEQMTGSRHAEWIENDPNDPE